MTPRRAAYAALVIATLSLYAVMLLWSLPRITEAAGGLPAPDMRPAGYSHDEAVAFLSALDADARAFYLSVQHRLDAVYPLFLGLTLGLALWHLLRRAAWPLRAGALLLCAGVTAADWLENARVAALLRAAPGEVSVDMVAAASRASVAKAALTSLALLAVFGLGAARGIGRMKGGRRV
ncbi:MAG: hypothetical protein ACP5DX_05530 [Paracoccaceae bacterium]